MKIKFPYVRIKHDFLWSDVESKFVAGVHQNG